MRKISLLLVILLGFSFLSACSALQFEDTNGDEDYSLQSIVDEDIVRSSNHVSVGSFETTVNNVTKLTTKKFNGVRSLETFRNNTYTIEVSFKVTKGNAKLVLCDGDSILHEFEVNQDNQTYSFTCDERVQLKIAGEDCAFELRYTYSK